MKKGTMIAVGTAAGVLAVGTALFLLSGNSRTEAIRSYLQNGRELSPAETEWLDLNQDGLINRSDLLLARMDALQHQNSPETYFVSAHQAKQLGRTAYHGDTYTLWCSLSGSGIAFTTPADRVTFSLTADSAYTSNASPARYAVYVGDTRAAEGLLTEQEQAVTVETNGVQDIRLVKLSESSSSALGIRAIRLDIDESVDMPILTPAFPKDHLIEFIGDSITCGYGVDGVLGDTFSTATEDATKAYACLTAQMLRSDYSLVSYSGHGVLSGYTATGMINRTMLVPGYYGQVGHCSAVVESRHKIQDDKWDFSVQPDLIVINLGTNDASYTGTDRKRQQEFISAYIDFLKQVRENNPDAPILCTLGTMGQGLCEAVEQAAVRYTMLTQDTNITTMRFDMQQDADGYGVDYHPSAATHEKAANQLAGFIHKWLGWDMDT